MMRDTEKLRIEYLGYKNPGTQDEVELEVLGLELAIKSAEQRVAHLKQALRIAYMKSKSVITEGPPKDE